MKLSDYLKIPTVAFTALSLVSIPLGYYFKFRPVVGASALGIHAITFGIYCGGVAILGCTSAR